MKGALSALCHEPNIPGLCRSIENRKVAVGRTAVPNEIAEGKKNSLQRTREHWMTEEMVPFPPRNPAGLSLAKRCGRCNDLPRQNPSQHISCYYLPLHSAIVTERINKQKSIQKRNSPSGSPIAWHHAQCGDGPTLSSALPSPVLA
jgi:hypothetical protein